ncbi:MAG: PAS domain S-box protein, partial [Ardenticatenaceae bacterium]
SPLKDENEEIIGAIGVATDVTERKRAEEAVRESEEKYRILFEHSRDSIFISKDGAVVDANQATLEMFGYTREEATGFQTQDVYFNQDDASKVRRLLDERGFVREAEVKLKRKDGTVIDCILSVTRRRADDGAHIGDYGIIHDITERKRAEERLRENERRLQALVSELPVPVSLTRLSDGLFINANEHLGELFGVPRDDLINRKASDFYSDPADRQALIDELNCKGFIRNHEIRGRKADGTPFWVTVSVQPFQFEGEDLLLTAFYDTTERKRAEELFRTVAQSSPVGMFVIQNGKFSFVNNQFAKDTGFKAGELVGRDCMSVVHMDDRQHVNNCVVGMLKGEVSTPYEFRGLDKDGSAYWLMGTVAPIEYEGKPAIVGTYMDVTERKRAEEAVRNSEEQARRLAHENAMMAEVGRIIGSSLNLDDVYEGFAEQVREIIPFDRISIGLVNEANGTFIDSYAMGLPVPNRGFGVVSPLAKSVTSELVRTRQGFIIDIESEDELAERFPLLVPGFRAGLRTTLSVPLISKDEVMGALHFQSIMPDAYTERELALAGRVAYY